MRTSNELCELAKHGDSERIKLLLLAGCQVNARDYDARTCLHLAASEGRTHVIEELIQNGATIDCHDR